MNSDNDQTLREALNFSRLTLDLDETIDANVQNQLVRLQLARAFLMTRTQVYLFDCVDAGVSNDEANFLLEAAGRLAERGAVVFWATMNFSSNFSSHLSSVALFDQVIDLAPKTKRKRKLTDKISKAKLLAPTMSSFQHDEESR
jgi:ABC-type branched-subunit amino acid transport system ATPase component